MCCWCRRETPRDNRGVLKTQLSSVPISYLRTDSLSSDNSYGRKIVFRVKIAENRMTWQSERNSPVKFGLRCLEKIFCPRWRSSHEPPLNCAARRLVLHPRSRPPRPCGRPRGRLLEGHEQP